MESLLSTYASSDDEDEPQQQQQTTLSASKTLLSCLPKPTESSNFTSLPQHKSSDNNNFTDPKQTTISVSSAKALFSALPQPKSQQQQKPPKKIVQIKNPFASSTNPINDDDDEDDDEDEKEKRRRKEAAQSSLQTSSVKSFLATIPAARNSGSLGSGLSSGRRAILDTSPTVDGSEPVEDRNQLGGDENFVSYDMGGGGGSDSNGSYGTGLVDASSGSYAGYEAYPSGVGVDQNAVAAGDNGGYGYGGNYAEYGGYEYYGNSWGGGSGNVGAEMSSGSGESESALRVLGKRGRKDVPVEIVEVKQDELMKNRPREDQVKLTGIAFGPSYKPVSAAGKPSKLHKRKHQIGSLYFDMKQKEMELQERRAKGFLTKAETQAKYGW